MTDPDHTTARKVAGFMIAIGWIRIALGAVVAVLGLGMAVTSTSTFGFGLTAVGTGLLDVAVGYGLRAVLDVADNTSDILAELRRSGRLSPGSGSVNPESRSLLASEPSTVAEQGSRRLPATETVPGAMPTGFMTTTPSNCSTAGRSRRSPASNGAWTISRL